MSSEYERYSTTYTEWTGASIVAKFNGQQFATLNGITYTVVREQAPIYAVNPRSFTRGKRGIAGKFISKEDFCGRDLIDMFESADKEKYETWVCKSKESLPGWPDVEVPKGIQRDYRDQLPPFDVTIKFINEEGQEMTRNLYGVEVLWNGTCASYVTKDESYAFVCIDVGPEYREESDAV